MSSSESILGNFSPRAGVDYLSTRAAGTFPEASFSNSLEAWQVCLYPGPRFLLEQANAVE
jgi:hypothetical protein